MISFELPNLFGAKDQQHIPVAWQEPASFWTRCRRKIYPNEEQRSILIIIGLQLLVITLLYQFRLTRWLLYPFELIGTVFHEFGHAFVCVITGGSIKSIDINIDESGLTRFSGGWYCAIVPAGYIGSSIAGCILLFTGFSKKHSRYVAMAVGCILLITLFWSGGLSTVIITLFLVASMAFAIWYQEGMYIQYMILFMGTMASIVSILNILSSTVFHTIDGSDAVAFARHCSILIPSFVYGLLWAIISLTLIAGFVGSALIYYK